MRIIAGSARGRKLHAPPGHSTRPTPARVREALFSILVHDIAAARVLDLFAGSGALGLEALSRGARHVTFVEPARAALGCLRRNATPFSEATYTILPLTAQQALPRLAQQGCLFDLIFLDPPFASGFLAPMLDKVVDLALLSTAAVVVCEHPSDVRAFQEPAGCRTSQTRCFGDVGVTVMRLEPPDAAKKALEEQ